MRQTFEHSLKCKAWQPESSPDSPVGQFALSKDHNVFKLREKCLFYQFRCLRERVKASQPKSSDLCRENPLLLTEFILVNAAAAAAADLWFIFFSEFPQQPKESKKEDSNRWTIV